MRLLLYFLALLTGISAADAARPVEAASPTSAAAQLDFAEAVASSAAAITVGAINIPDGDGITVEIVKFASTPATVQASTPVSRADCARR